MQAIRRVKVYNSLALEVYRAIGATAKRLRMRVVGHVPFAVGLRRALDAQQHSIEHLTEFFRDTGFGLANLATVAAATRDSGTWNCPTLTVHHQLASTEDTALRVARPEVRYLSKGLVGSWRGRAPSGAAARFGH